ncbi:formylglycine-generating enzyme required for sulfatase activity [Roseiarcus fermentans]|uniref:Formylglycine-generating enzyme required for sulfatase activity n=1 Tax=Roseiarcus fermentans TaxID=1473586 RepID=A0A366F7M3_9HYPH|nr:SUMF1/EgtB/PvdO family nonheme iron enzyme [Roseiarcus fermentans]RBP09759.1 formylglycine-generating enzyme required for sulfatase activity [Roseiarcus fermentans]
MSDPDRTRGPIHSLRGARDDVAPGEGPVRRLAAIVAADISGYSRLMQLDEEGTYARLTRQRRELIEPTVAEHHGRLVKYTGDGFLAMFDSPVEAVRCAVVVQQSMVGRNTSLPRDQWIQYRIGVHLGDVIVEAADIYGDGVNIAARLEGIANPGQVYVSGGVYEQIKNKLVCAYQSLGDRQVKNITDPVSVYRVLPDPAALSEARRRRLPVALVSSALLGVIAVLGALTVFLLQRQSAIQTPAGARAPEAPAVVVTAPQPAPAEKLVAPAPAPAPAAAEKPVAAAPLPAVAQTIPEMVSIPGGAFAMGSDDDPTEKPVHPVTIKPFAIGKFPVTIREWNACVAAKVCGGPASGEDDAPIGNLSWTDAQSFVGWLASVLQKPVRLPTEAEWEFAARGGARSRFWWGDQLQPAMANCKGCGEPYEASQPAKVGSFKPNPFGLYDMGGNIDQWVEDCWHRTYQGAPSDGSAWVDSGCPSRVIRSGSWRNDPDYVRPSNRDHYDAAVRYPTHGLRVAYSL